MMQDTRFKIQDAGSKIDPAQSDDQDLLFHRRDTETTEKDPETINTTQDLHDYRINGFIRHPLASLAKDTKKNQACVPDFPGSLKPPHDQRHINKSNSPPFPKGGGGD
jgi:hypothetical protein